LGEIVVELCPLLKVALHLEEGIMAGGPLLQQLLAGRFPVNAFKIQNCENMKQLCSRYAIQKSSQEFAEHFTSSLLFCLAY